MKTQEIILSLTRNYIFDLTGPVLSIEIGHLLLGKLRARDLPYLSNLRKELGAHCHDSETYRAFLQIEAFFKKNADFCDDKVTSNAAISSFLEAEKRCKITNRRLEYYYLHHERLAPDMQLYISKMQKYIRGVLGPFSRFLQEIPELIRLTSGATSDTSRRESMPHQKLMRHISCPASAAPYLDALALYWGYPLPEKSFTCANRIEVVPKNWKTGRTIACEPSGSLPLQLAFDGYVKKRLKPHGINLSDQLRNRECARVGSIDGSFATVDLSMASDLCALNTVHFLLPEEWTRYLLACRSAHGVLPDSTTIKYEKFSSMGNGATFALETLIFLAACRAVGSSRALVYGDDIAIEPSHVPALTRLLSFLGFRVNTDKTYSTGSFRESCGGQYFNGYDVTPFYARGGFDKLPNLILLINSMAGRTIPEGRCWNFLRSLVDGMVPIIPFSDNDISGVHIDVHSAYRQGLIKFRKSICYVTQLSYKTRKIKLRPYADLALSFLWYLRHSTLDRNYQDVMRYGPEVRKVTFGKQPMVQLSTARYVRRRVPWVYPRRPLPDHMYMWSEYLLRAQKAPN